MIGGQKDKEKPCPSKFQFRSFIEMKVKCPPFNRITFGRHKSDNNNRMIQLTDVFCALSICTGCEVSSRRFFSMLE
jgi:hypothetical protein